MVLVRHYVFVQVMMLGPMDLAWVTWIDWARFNTHGRSYQRGGFYRSDDHGWKISWYFWKYRKYQIYIRYILAMYIEPTLQMTQPTVSKHWRKIGPRIELQCHQVHPTALTVIQNICTNTQIDAAKSTHSEMGPVWQNPTQTVRTAHLSVLMTVHSFSTQYNTEQFW